jgi:hypothetical protein
VFSPKGVFLKLDFRRHMTGWTRPFLRQIFQWRSVDDGWLVGSRIPLQHGALPLTLMGKWVTILGWRVRCDKETIYFISSSMPRWTPLAENLERARISSHIFGVGGHLIPRDGVTHLQYTMTPWLCLKDRTLIFSISSSSYFVLRLDKSISTKSEVVVLGYPPEI